MKGLLFVAALVAAGAPVAAEAADPPSRRAYAERSIVVVERRDPGLDRGYTGLLPACSDPEVHGRVARAFANTEREYWASDLELTTFVRPREIGYRPWGRSFIPRRFCIAETMTTDGRRRHVSYSVREWQAPGTVSWGVEWCVSGLDRHYSYAPNCKMARP